MPFSLLPKVMAPSLTALTPELLEGLGVRLLMLDFDNTIVPYTTNIPTEPVKSWLEQMQSSGFTVCVVSNSHNSRVPEFCEKYGLNCITHAKKPTAKGIRQCLNRFEILAEQAVLVGDQIYTDTLGGGLAGVRTVLVRSIHNHTIWLKLRHVAEMPFIFAARNRRITK